MTPYVSLTHIKFQTTGMLCDKMLINMYRFTMVVGKESGNILLLCCSEFLFKKLKFLIMYHYNYYIIVVLATVLIIIILSFADKILICITLQRKEDGEYERREFKTLLIYMLL